MLKEKLIEHLISEGKTDTWVNLYEKYPYKGHNLTNKQKGDAVRKLNKRLQRNSNMTQPKVNSLDELYYNIGYDGHFDEEVRLEDKRDGNYIIIADAHAPFINMKAWKSMISIIKDIKSTIAGIVYAGDFLDLNSLSFYDKGKMPLPGIDLSFEYKQSSKFFNLVERELPKHCYRAFLFGNHCFDENTELLTNKGWVTYNNATEDMLFASYNKDTNELEYVKPNRIIKYEYDGIMHYYTGNKIDLAVTPNHKMLTKICGRKSKYEFELSKDVRDSCRYFKTAIEENSDTYYMEHYLKDDEIRLAAWIYTDGSILKNGNFKAYKIYQSKENTTERIKTILDNLNIKYTLSNRNRTIDAISNKVLKTILPQNEFYINTNQYLDLVSDKYKFDDWVYKLNSRQFKIFLEELVLGDGSKHKSSPDKSWCFYGKKSVIEELQILCFLNGISTSIYNYRDTQYRLNIHVDSTETKLNSVKDHSNFKENSYKGIVWCIETKHGTVVCRRNGKVSIQGNCDRALRHLKTPDGQRYGERLLSPIHNLNLKERGYEVYTNWVEDEVHIGDLTIIHGAFHNDHVAKKHLDVFKKNIAFGHVHRQQIYRTRNHKAYSIGCMLDINAPAFNYATKSMKETWSTGFAIASVFKGKTTLQLIQWDYDNECFFFGGKMYQ